MNRNEQQQNNYNALLSWFGKISKKKGIIDFFQLNNLRVRIYLYIK